jgi:cobalamin-dependent methionine synthase I
LQQSLQQLQQQQQQQQQQVQDYVAEVQTSGSAGWLCFAAVAAPEAARSSRCRLHYKGSDIQVLWVSAKSCCCKQRRLKHW